MRKFFKDICNNIFVTWLFSPSGLGVLSLIVGGILVYLTKLTDALSHFAPISYGIAFIIGIYLSLRIFKVIAKLNHFVSEKLGTKQSTYAKFKIENNRLNMTAKSNIHKGPYIQIMERIIMPAPQLNRQQKRAQSTQNKVTTIPDNHNQGNVFAFVIFQFEKPIRSADFHLRVVSDGGTLPTTNDNALDERWACISLSNLVEGSTFTIFFNSNGN